MHCMSAIIKFIDFYSLISKKTFCNQAMTENTESHDSW